MILFCMLVSLLYSVDKYKNLAPTHSVQLTEKTVLENQVNDFPKEISILFDKEKRKHFKSVLSHIFENQQKRISFQKAMGKWNKKIRTFFLHLIETNQERKELCGKSYISEKQTRFCSSEMTKSQKENAWKHLNLRGKDKEVLSNRINKVVDFLKTPECLAIYAREIEWWVDCLENWSQLTILMEKNWLKVQGKSKDIWKEMIIAWGELSLLKKCTHLESVLRDLLSNHIHQVSLKNQLKAKLIITQSIMDTIKNKYTDIKLDSSLMGKIQRMIDIIGCYKNKEVTDLLSRLSLKNWGSEEEEQFYRNRLVFLNLSKKEKNQLRTKMFYPIFSDEECVLLSDECLNILKDSHAMSSYQKGMQGLTKGLRSFFEELLFFSKERLRKIESSFQIGMNLSESQFFQFVRSELSTKMNQLLERYENSIYQRGLEKIHQEVIKLLQINEKSDEGFVPLIMQWKQLRNTMVIIQERVKSKEHMVFYRDIQSLLLIINQKSLQNTLENYIQRVRLSLSQYESIIREQKSHLSQQGPWMTTEKIIFYLRVKNQLKLEKLEQLLREEKIGKLNIKQGILANKVVERRIIQFLNQVQIDMKEEDASKRIKYFKQSFPNLFQLFIDYNDVVVNDRVNWYLMVDRASQLPSKVEEREFEPWITQKEQGRIEHILIQLKNRHLLTERLLIWERTMPIGFYRCMWAICKEKDLLNINWSAWNMALERQEKEQSSSSTTKRIEWIRKFLEDNMKESILLIKWRDIENVFIHQSKLDLELNDIIWQIQSIGQKLKRDDDQSQHYLDHLIYLDKQMEEQFRQWENSRIVIERRIWELRRIYEQPEEVVREDKVMMLLMESILKKEKMWQKKFGLLKKSSNTLIVSIGEKVLKIIRMFKELSVKYDKKGSLSVLKEQNIAGIPQKIIDEIIKKLEEHNVNEKEIKEREQVRLIWHDQVLSENIDDSIQKYFSPLLSRNEEYILMAYMTPLVMDPTHQKSWNSFLSAISPSLMIYFLRMEKRLQLIGRTMYEKRKNDLKQEKCTWLEKELKIKNKLSGLKQRYQKVNAPFYLSYIKQMEGLVAQGSQFFVKWKELSEYVKSLKKPESQKNQWITEQLDSRLFYRLATKACRKNAEDIRFWKFKYQIEERWEKKLEETIIDLVHQQDWDSYIQSIVRREIYWSQVKLCETERDNILKIIRTKNVAYLKA